jgi:hypothetical protein
VIHPQIAHFLGFDDVQRIGWVVSVANPEPGVLGDKASDLASTIVPYREKRSEYGALSMINLVSLDNFLGEIRDAARMQGRGQTVRSPALRLHLHRHSVLTAKPV